MHERMGSPLSFVEYLVGKGLRRNTVRVYLHEVELAESWFAERGERLEDAGPLEIADYAATRPFTAAVQGHVRAGLTHWWEWKDLRGWPKAIDVPRDPQPVCKALEPDDVTLIVKIAKGWWPEGTLVLLGIGLGLRNAELRRLRWECFDQGLEWATITGKNSRVRRLVVPEGLRRELRNYRQNAGYLFVGRFGDPITHATVSNWVKKVAAEAGVTEQVWPHRLRHTFGAEANDDTGELRAVARAMGHAKVETTEIYTRTTAQALHRVADSLDKYF